MQGIVGGFAAADQRLFGAALVDTALGKQGGQQVFEVQPLVMKWGDAHKSSFGHRLRQILVWP